MCPTDKGKASRNATALSFWLIILAGILPLAISQKIQFFSKVLNTLENNLCYAIFMKY